MYIILNPEWQKLKYLRELLNILIDAKIVGGAVRNAIMGLPISDIDIACALKPDQIKEIAEKNGFHVIPTGIEHGTVTCVKDDESYEVTTLRADKNTDGRHAQVEFITSEKIDAERRDFTMNALFSDFEGNVVDYVNGLEDAKRGHLRFIGNPSDRIKEDYLRILRFFRFYSYYASSYDQLSLLECLNLHSGLKIISKERCTYEFMKIMKSQNPWKALNLMSEDILSSAGLPSLDKDKIEPLIRSVEFVKQTCGVKISEIGNVGIFNDLGDMMLSKQMARQILAIQKQHPMYTLKDYIIWINTCPEGVIWDGIIVKGFINDKILPYIDIWIKNRFPLQGRDILALGVKPGPEVSRYLQLGLNIFASTTIPVKKDDLMREIAIQIRTKQDNRIHR